VRFAEGQPPKGKGKPKSSPLDGDSDFQELAAKVMHGMKPRESAGIFIDQVADGKRLGAKNPARMVRDHMNRLLSENEFADLHTVTCFQTEKDGVWAVWVTRLDVGPNRTKST